jgi:hypothetical protein
MALQILQLVHIAITALPWVIAIFFRHPVILLLCLAGQILAMVQWLVFGHCLLNPLENNGSTESAAMEWTAEWLRIPLENFKRGFVLVNAAAPSFLNLSRIAGYLGL